MGAGRAGTKDDVGVMNVDGTDGIVVLVLFPDCEIVIVVGGIPAEVVLLTVEDGSMVFATLARAAFAAGSVSV